MSNQEGQPIRVSVAGFGTVGQGVVRLLKQEADRYQDDLGVRLQLIGVLDRSHRKKDTSWVSSDAVRFLDTVEEFQALEADVVVELIGGMEPAGAIIQRALSQGRSVVTANKLVMARRGAEFSQLAAERGAYLGFEAAVAGGIPIIQVVRQSLLSDRILEVRAILNGTCNFVLTEMAEKGSAYEEVLAEAQAHGYAEADPTLDVSGQDTTDKLAILSTLCFHSGVAPEQIPTRGITELDPVDFLYARKLDSTIRLLGVARRNDDGTLALRVSPFLVENSLALAKISGVLNAVEVTGSSLGSVVLSGRGAGAEPTAVSVMADILNAAQWNGNAIERASSTWERKAQADAEKESYPFYLRFVISDRPGIIAALAQILASRGINIDSVFQERWPERSDLPFVITTEPTAVSAIQTALEEMKQLDFNRLDPVAFPMLRG